MTEQADNIQERWDLDEEFCPVCGEALQFGDPPFEGWCENLNCPECDDATREEAWKDE